MLKKLLIAAVLVTLLPLAASAGIDGPYLSVRAQISNPVEDFYELECWEDEIVVQVVHDPYGLAATDLACVPGDNVPWDPDGYRPNR